MTRVLPILPTDLSKASTYDLLSYLSTRLAERAEAESCPCCDEATAKDCFYCNGTGVVPTMREYEEKLSDITTELLMRVQDKTPEEK